jgi:hypothetical protein|tara:strand:- start:263 stop:496 length:234 start_codon:yes stop_codon:yes gene_type:complete
MPSDTAKKYLSNRPDKQKRFDELMNEMGVDMAFESRVSEVLRQLREEDMGPKSIPGKLSIGGEVEIKKGKDYIKDLL